jgi:hypothetical protein
MGLCLEEACKLEVVERRVWKQRKAPKSQRSSTLLCLLAPKLTPLSRVCRAFSYAPAACGAAGADVTRCCAGLICSARPAAIIAMTPPERKTNW